MVWEHILGWLDNPIFVKYMRSRLRLQSLLRRDRGGAGAVSLHRLGGLSAQHVRKRRRIRGAVSAPDHHHHGGRRHADRFIGGRVPLVGHSRFSPRLAAVARRADAGVLLRRSGAGVRAPGDHAAVRALVRRIWHTERAWAHPVDDRSRCVRVAVSRIGAREAHYWQSPEPARGEGSGPSCSW